MPEPGEHTWQGKRILLVSPEAWGPVRLSKHHYAKTLAEHGARVFFLDPVRPGVRGITVERLADEGVTLVRTPPMLRGLRFLPAPVRARMEARRLAAIARACGGGFDLLWNFDLYRFRYLRDRTFARLRLLHMMDLRVPRDLPQAARNADGVVLISEWMREAVGTGVPLLRVPHGLMPNRSPGEAPEGLLPGLRLGYLGNLAIRLVHWPSMLAIARAHPEATLYLIGPTEGVLGGDGPIDKAAWRTLIALPNVRLVGPVPHDRTAAWLGAMDVLLIAYDTERFPREASNSHKVLEYLNSGKVVLASHMADRADYGDLVVMMPPGGSIAEGIGDVLGRLPELNSPERMAARTAFAGRMTYAAHLPKLASFIGDLLPRQ